MPGQVPEEVKKERIQTLIKLQNKISLEKNREVVGQIQEILVEGEKSRDELFLCGRNRGGKMVFFKGGRELIGCPVPVNIERAHLAYLVGCRTQV
ncbi:MAG: (Dimethylallyl)adenosine tRNA methylthiotransferase MiaB [Firmicutes bacterium ADurb.Bin456]|nr:MAG: (Dimethylallyl)adenosine tRNA methylthiotransferase MiaB [Firmicutes bacterium ADurb.Bin456]